MKAQDTCLPSSRPGPATSNPPPLFLSLGGRKEINDERFTGSGAGEQSTDTKSAIGGTRMSEAATPAVAAGTGCPRRESSAAPGSP